MIRSIRIMEAPIENEVEKQIEKSLAPGFAAPEQEPAESEFISDASVSKLQKEQFPQ